MSFIQKVIGLGFIITVVWMAHVSSAHAAISESDMQDVKVKVCKAAHINPGCIIIVQDESINAYTNGTHRIYVNTGTLEACDNDDQMAMIYAHEISHLLNKDPEHPDKPTMRKEKLADMKGRKIMMAAGYNPVAAAPLWLKMEAKYGIDGGDHPDNDTRYTFWMTGKPYWFPK